MRRICWFILLVVPVPVLGSNEVPKEAIELRNRGIAELENEQPKKATELFTTLTKIVPNDPLGYANLAISYLRVQEYPEATSQIEAALSLTPNDPHLLAIQGEILQWSGRPELALGVLTRAAELASSDLEIQYALYRQAEISGGEKGPAAAKVALARLARLRPENLVVLLQLGQRSIASGDRAAATGAFLRIRELAWQAAEVATTLLDQVLSALEANDLEAARVPGRRLENVLKIAPMFQQSRRELVTGIHGIPILSFLHEPPITRFGSPIEISFRATSFSNGRLAGRALVAGDFDADQTSDLAWIESAVTGTDGAGDKKSTLYVDCSSASSLTSYEVDTDQLRGLVALDLDNDGNLDLLGYGPQQIRFWRGVGGGRFEVATKRFGLDSAGAKAVVPLDYDIEGDLDLATVGGPTHAPELLRNSLDGPLQAVGTKVFPEIELRDVFDILATDLDRDGDLDLVIAQETGLTYLKNLRQGKFSDATEEAGLDSAKGAKALLSVDLDNDGWPDLIGVDRGLEILHNRSGRMEAWDFGDGLRTSARFSAITSFDADNDGTMDLAVTGPDGLVILQQRERGGFNFVKIQGGPTAATALVALDQDKDGDVDLVVGGPQGLHLLENIGGNKNRWLAVRLRGLNKGNSKNNMFGLGATLEVRSGSAYQFREVTSDVTHFGVGDLQAPEVVRAVWTNGVPQNRLDPKTSQWIVEEQVLKGSCPFLYAWNGNKFTFVTDLLWDAPVGLPFAPGVWAPAHPEELIKIEGVEPSGDEIHLKVTEELWEAAFFDYLRLWVVDHPEEVEVASSLRILPGGQVPMQVMGTRGLRPMSAAWDAAGNNITERVRLRDEIYADGWDQSPYQGIAQNTWAIIFELGEAPGTAIRLHLDGWYFPADASLNLATAQISGWRPVTPRLEIETTAGWEVLMPNMGFPAGKTKTMVVDTPRLPAGAHRLRIISNQWLSWDRMAWSTTPADDSLVVVARLAPTLADLHYRGFSAPVRRAPNAPHSFDYTEVHTESPWITFPGNYTKFGDVRELLARSDDRSVILAPGDEISLVFSIKGLTPLAPGTRRTFFLESHGWDKDADRNTYAADQVEPLPFRAMSGYPYGKDEAFPDTPLHREYLEKWLTRVIEPRRDWRSISDDSP